MAQIIELKHASNLYGKDNVVIDRVKITPKIAGMWLKANRYNRPLSASHVATLAKQMETGHWMFNAQPVIISDTEQVLDGQHRLQAVIESGAEIETVVVYGIAEEAFATIDTGKTRNGRDTLVLTYRDATITNCQTVAAAARFCILFSAKIFGRKERVSNPEIKDFVADHMILWQMAEDLSAWSGQAIPLGLGQGVAMYWLFSQKNKSAATQFMRGLYSGEGLLKTSAIYIAREKLLADRARQVRWGVPPKTRLLVKAWNVFRKGGPATAAMISPKSSDPRWITIK